MSFREKVGNLTNKFAKYIAIGAVVSGGGGMIRQGLAENTLEHIAEGQRTGNMVEDAPAKRAEAVQQITNSQVLKHYGTTLFEDAILLGIAGGMIEGSKKKSDSEPEGRRKGPAPTV